MNKIRAFLGYRMRALIRKEFRQVLRDRRLAMSLILPPTLQLLLFGFALNATVSNLRLGVVDDSRTPESRELVAIMTESKSFRGAGAYFDINEMSKKIADGNLDAGLVIPYDYARDLQRGGAAREIEEHRHVVPLQLAERGRGAVGPNDRQARRGELLLRFGAFLRGAA